MSKSLILPGTTPEAVSGVPRGAALDAVVGSMVWPIWRRFLDSDHTLESLAKAAFMKPAQIERAFINPGRLDIRKWGAIAAGLEAHVIPTLYPVEEHEQRLRARLGFTEHGTSDPQATPGKPNETNTTDQKETG